MTEDKNYDTERISDADDVSEMMGKNDPQFSRGERFYEDVGWADEDDIIGETMSENRSVYEVERVLRDLDTDEIMYRLQSVAGVEAMLLTEEQLTNSEAYYPEP